MDTDSNEPVLVVTDSEGYLVEAGDPKCFKPKKLGEYAQEGYQIKTITIKEYREKIKYWKWYWEKEKAGSVQS